MGNSESFYILALDGGGARGIYPAQVLANLERELEASVKDCFDLIAGTSTGSIIAGAAAVGVPMAQIVELFEKEAPRIFRKRFLRWGILGSKYSRRPFEDIVCSMIPDTTLGKISTPLMITGSDISTGGVYVFKSGYMAEIGVSYVRDRDTLLSDAILASCAAPYYFDPAKVGDYLLADGGLWANNPSITALAEAVGRFGKDVSDVRILSVGTGHTNTFYREQKSWGIATGWGHKKLVAYFLSLQSQASMNMSRLLLKNGYLRLDPEIGDWGLDDTRYLANLKAIADRDFAARFGEIQKYRKR